MENDCCAFDLSDHPGVDGSGQIEKFQEKALMELQDYVQKTYPDDTYRYIHTSTLTSQLNLPTTVVVSHSELQVIIVQVSLIEVQPNM